MPNKDNDNQCISKKRHIGNDFVTIIYDDSKHGYKFGTIKVEFSYIIFLSGADFYVFYKFVNISFLVQCLSQENRFNDSKHMQKMVYVD